MKTVTMLILLIMLFPSFAFSGKVYGSIKEGKNSVEEGIKVEIEALENIYTGVTGANGSYSINVEEKGKCTLIVYYKQQFPSIQIYSYEQSSVRYDLILEKDREGIYRLRRK